MWLTKEELKAKLVGKKVKKIFYNESHLKFETDQGNVLFEVEGDCCSHSYFFDFYGVKKLLENGPITDFKEVELKEGDFNYFNGEKDGDSIQCYGYAITTENKELGEQTSVFSFRNSSNGYYGGSLEWRDGGADLEVSPEITDDVIEIK